LYTYIHIHSKSSFSSVNFRQDQFCTRKKNIFLRFHSDFRFFRSFVLLFACPRPSAGTAATIKGIIIGMTFNIWKLQQEFGAEFAFNDIMTMAGAALLLAISRVSSVNPFIPEGEDEEEEEDEDEGSPSAQSCLLHRQPVTRCTDRLLVRRAGEETSYANTHANRSLPSL
jgi:hypothetical protein